MADPKDATDKGVSAEQEAPSLLTDRNSIMESIIESNDEAAEKYDKDMGLSEDDDGEGTQLPDETDDKGTPGEEDPPAADVEMVKVVVDGEEKEIPLSEIMDAGKRTYQKESAADKRLEEATRLLKEAKEQKPPEDDLPGEDQAQMTPQEIAEALQYGTAEDAAQAIEQLNNQGRSQEAVTPERIQEIAKKTIQETNNAEKIASKFHQPKDDGGFKDLTDDLYLRNMVIENVNEQLKAGKANTWETYEKAGTEVRGWLSGHVGGEKQDSFAGKKEKKKTIDNVQAAGAVKGKITPQTKGQTASEVIEELGASRPGR